MYTPRDQAIAIISVDILVWMANVVLVQQIGNCRNQLLVLVIVALVQL